ncbi:MAG: DUF523 and DUF1722 domain-containing protein [Pirellulaceae bacterium]
MNDLLPIPEKPRVGVSACLVGEAVRYDGDHQQHGQVVGPLADLFELISICPEVEIGLGIPREPIQLEQAGSVTRLVAIQSRTDHTGVMQDFSRRTALQLEDRQVCGYILKSKSPSCGLERVKRFDETGTFQRDGQGIFALGLQQHAPGLPLVEESALEEESNRQHFITRVQAFRRLRTCLSTPWNPARMRDFHAAHRHLLESHHQPGYQQLETDVARIDEQEPASFRARYRQVFLEIMAHPVEPRQRD